MQFTNVLVTRGLVEGTLENAKLFTAAYELWNKYF